MHKILAKTLFLGKEILYLPECHSTNDAASQKFRNKELGEGGIVITDRQTQGRGQRGNTWESEPHQNLTLSLVLSPRFLDPREQFGLNMAIALGIREALAVYGSGILVKWPNDIVHEQGGKIGGILIENTVSQRGMEVSIVGIGLNINQTAFSYTTATSMACLYGNTLDKEEILETVICNIERFYLLLKDKRAKSLKDLYLSRLFRFGKLSSYDDGERFLGTITDITDQGKLIIEKERGDIKAYAFKEVRFL
jgi:BirA family biotin operon repressor/biotin-[acetyl-CoA-carboxylase] ligase